ncbi:MAG: hypothetical protein WCA46_16265 [Actinocatenispora sp.]
MVETGTRRPAWSIWPLAGFGIVGGLVLVVLTGVLLFGAARVPPAGRSVSVSVDAYQPRTGAVHPTAGDSFSGGLIPAAVLDHEDLAAVSGPVTATWSSGLGNIERSLHRSRAGDLPAVIPLAGRPMYPTRYTFLLTHQDPDGHADRLLARAVVRVTP